MVYGSVAPSHYITKSEERRLNWFKKVDLSTGRVVAYPSFPRKNARGSKARAKSKYSRYQDAIASLENQGLNQDTTNMGLFSSSYLATCLPSNDSSDSRSIDELCTHYQNNQETIHSANSADNNNLNNIDSADSANEQNKHNVVESNNHRKTKGQNGMSKNESESIDTGIDIMAHLAQKYDYQLMFLTITTPSGFVDPDNKTPDGKDLLGELFTTEDYSRLLQREAEIIRSIRQGILEILKEYNLPLRLIGVKEEGLKRLNTHGQLTIHYHFVILWKWISRDKWEEFVKRVESLAGRVYYNNLLSARKKGKKLFMLSCCSNEVWKPSTSNNKGFGDNTQQMTKDMKKYLTKNKMKQYLTKNKKEAEGVNKTLDGIKNSPYTDLLPNCWIIIDNNLREEIKIWKQKDIVVFDMGEKTASEVEGDLLYYYSILFTEPKLIFAENYKVMPVAIVCRVIKGKTEEALEILSDEYYRSSRCPSHDLRRLERKWEIEFEELNKLKAA